MVREIDVTEFPGILPKMSDPRCIRPGEYLCSGITIESEREAELRNRMDSEKCPRRNEDCHRDYHCIPAYQARIAALTSQLQEVQADYGEAVAQLTFQREEVAKWKTSAGVLASEKADLFLQLVNERRLVTKYSEDQIDAESALASAQSTIADIDLALECNGNPVDPRAQAVRDLARKLGDAQAMLEILESLRSILLKTQKDLAAARDNLRVLDLLLPIGTCCRCGLESRTYDAGNDERMCLSCARKEREVIAGRLVEAREEERRATAVVVFLAGKLATSDKPPAAWIMQGFSETNEVPR